MRPEGNFMRTNVVKLKSLSLFTTFLKKYHPNLLKYMVTTPDGVYFFAKDELKIRIIPDVETRKNLSSEELLFYLQNFKNFLQDDQILLSYEPALMADFIIVVDPTAKDPFLTTADMVLSLSTPEIKKLLKTHLAKNEFTPTPRSSS
ncbi:MAG TPA: hypothetical protein DIV86_06905 [Alphaproteobacteria bacterium]|nr:hypothetical protein [Alphaproteobacteria bacterium]